MSDPLETPRGIGELYIARGPDVSVLRPIMTGDVFKDVDIPGVEKTDGDEARLAMVVSHPCSMRDGYKLKSGLQALRVLPSPPIELAAWKFHYDLMPLPNLMEVAEDDTVNPDGAYVAKFDLRGRVAVAGIKLECRIACLSEEGVGFLHQRMGHADTRFAPHTADLVAACAGPFIEAELSEEWNRKILPPLDGLDSEKRDEVLAAGAKEFDELLGTLRESPVPGKKAIQYRLRDDLSIPKKAPGARREVLRLIKQRAQQVPGS